MSNREQAISLINAVPDEALGGLLELLRSFLADIPNAATAAALDEYAEMRADPQKYKRYASFRDAMKEVLSDA